MEFVIVKFCNKRLDHHKWMESAIAKLYNIISALLGDHTDAK